MPFSLRAHDGVFSLPSAVLARAGTTTTRWRLLLDERTDLRKALRAGRLLLATATENRADRVLYGRGRLRR